MGLGDDHTHDLDQTVLSTSDLEAIYDYLSDLKAPYGFIPSYFNYLSEDQLLDSSNFPVFDDPNYLPGLNPNHMGFIPANQVDAPNPYLSEELTRAEALEYLMEDWANGMVGQERLYYDKMQDLQENLLNHAYKTDDPEETRAWITGPKYEEDIPMMDYLAKITDSPELALGKGFFPIRNYPQVALDYLREYIDSGAEVGEITDDEWDSAAGLFRVDSWDDPLGSIEFDPYYTKDMATKANILGHEGLHGAVYRYPFLLETAPYRYAGETKQPFNIQMAEKYDPGKRYMYNRHFSSKAAFHPAIHGIDETFFGGHGQPSSMLDRVNEINPQNIANANFLMNYSAQKDKQLQLSDSLSNWKNMQDYFNTGDSIGPAGMGGGTGTTYGPAL